MHEGYKSTCPWDDSPVKQPVITRAIILAINEVAFALRDARRRMEDGHERMSEDERAALHQHVTQEEADDLTSIILDFSDEFARTMGLFLGVVSWRDFTEQMRKVGVTVKELEAAIDQKTEEMDTTRRRVRALEDAQVAAQATESALRERVAHLERALMYASAQVSARR